MHQRMSVLGRLDLRQRQMAIHQHAPAVRRNRHMGPRQTVVIIGVQCGDVDLRDEHGFSISVPIPLHIARKGQKWGAERMNCGLFRGLKICPRFGLEQVALRNHL